MGRALIIVGLTIAAIGVLLVLGDKLPVKFGRLPGDIVIQRKNTTFYFPIVTCVVLSLLVTLLGWLFGRR